MGQRAVVREIIKQSTTPTIELNGRVVFAYICKHYKGSEISTDYMFKLCYGFAIRQGIPYRAVEDQVWKLIQLGWFTSFGANTYTIHRENNKETKNIWQKNSQVMMGGQYLPSV